MSIAQWATVVAVLAFGSTADAQASDPWTAALGEVTASFEGGAKHRFLVATPTDSADERAAAGALQALLLDAGIGTVVMDDSPLGDISTLSDDEIVTRAKVYPVDVVAIVRAFPGAQGSSVMVRIESQGEPTRTYALESGVPPVVTATEVEVASPKVAAAPAEDEAPVEAEVQETREETPAEKQAAPVVAPWVFEDEPGFGVIREEKAAIPWPSAYEELGGPQLKLSYQRRRSIRTGAFVAGGILAAVGAGVTYVTLLGSTNCAACRNDTMLGVGIGALSVGAVALLVGFVVKPHPLDADAVRALVSERNESAPAP